VFLYRGKDWSKYLLSGNVEINCAIMWYHSWDKSIVALHKLWTSDRFSNKYSCLLCLSAQECGSAKVANEASLLEETARGWSSETSAGRKVHLVTSAHKSQTDT